MRRPPHQQTAATMPALRGPACSSHPPQIAAAEPRNTKNIVYIQPSIEIFQSHVVEKTSAMNDMSAGHATDLPIPMACDKGNQNTLNPYAIPMHRWIASAAGGTSQRLYRGPAIVRSLSSSPASGIPPRSAATWLMSTPPICCYGHIYEQIPS